jgi:2-oxoisovalerate dehydrogenase E1 component
MVTEQLNVHIAYKRKKHHSDALLLQLYKALLLPRMIEEKMLNQLRMNKISKWFSGIGQEAIAVGVTEALQPDEYILPMHRNLGVFTSRHIPFHQLFKQWQGTLGGFTKGRDRSFHFGTNEYSIVGMISHLGPQLAVGSGIALADKLLQTNKITVAFTGEGATSEGDFHEALNVAAVWKLPVIFMIENNGYGLSTPTNEQYACKKLVDRALGYGIEGVQIDGNNILEVYDTINKLATSLRKDPRPVLIEALTFRMRGHEEASGVDYVPKHYFETWERKDPVTNFENYLQNIGLLTEESIAAIRAEFKQYIDSDLKLGFTEPPATASIEQELNDVYAPFTPPQHQPNLAQQSSKRFIEAISDALQQGMERHENMVIMGQDIAEYGGAFKITKGFVGRFGRERVRNTPICESAIVGISLGLSIKKIKSVVEMQFADFVTCAFNQIINNLAKSHWRWGQNADVVVRMPTGAGTGAGPFHSQSNEAWFFHSPGLKIVYPSNPYDAKGLLLAAIEDPNPVMYFEHKALYRSLVADVPDDYYTVPIGKANLVQSGDDVSIITYGMGVHWATKALATLPHISADVVDLRTLLPLDIDAIIATARKTGKVLILHEDSQTGGIGGEIAAIIAEHCFQYLDAPIVRCGALDTPIPFAIPLEQQYLPETRFKAALEKLAAF